MLVLLDNVDHVVRTLEMRFGQVDHVILTMIEGVQKLLKKEDFEQLLDLANAIGNLVATMTLMGNTGHQDNRQLRAETLHKLPSSLKRQLEGVHRQGTTSGCIPDNTQRLAYGTSRRSMSHP